MSRLLIAIFILFSFQSLAQSNYKPGAVVTTKGDTLKGLINYRGWFQNPEHIEFRPALDGKEQAFTPQNIVWFSVEGFGSYWSFIVPVSLNKLEFAELTIEMDTTYVEKAVFLKEILRGDRVTLFSFQDKIKKRFYIQQAGKDLPLELKYGKTVRELQEFKHEIFKDQLRRIAVRESLLTSTTEKLIQFASYSEADLKKIANSFNTRQEVTVRMRQHSGKRVGYFINAGINNHRLEYTGNSLITIDRLTPTGSDKFKEKVTTQSILPIMAVGADFFTNPVTRKLIIRTELSVFQPKSQTVSYSKDNYITDDEDENTYRLSLLNISLSPQLIYNFYTTNSFAAYGGAGFIVSLLKASENRVEQKPLNQGTTAVFVMEDYLHIRSSFLAPVARAGIQLFKQVDCSIVWIPPMNYSADRGNLRSAKGKQLIFSVGYLINRK